MSERPTTISTPQKALELNLDEAKYGTFVEIGAGQEVARQFFSAGGAAGTIAKTMSAYDMKVSDEIYGKASGYVSLERLEQMLTREYDLLIERLSAERPKTTEFFAYAATVTARSYKQKNESHGWLGVRLQLYPGAPPSEIVLHVRMLDDDNPKQSEALGILGVNLLYGACYLKNKPKKLIEGLLDNLNSDRVEIDLIRFSGPYFQEVDNRLMNLHLIRSWCCRAVMFDSAGASVVPASAMRKKDVIVMRGAFAPPTKLHLDMSQAAKKQLAAQGNLSPGGILNVAEITMADLGHAAKAGDGKSDDPSFLARVDLLTRLGYNVLISDYLRFFRLRSWMRNFTENRIAITLSVTELDRIFDDSFYEGLEGGILVALGKLFSDDTTVFVYPAEVDGRRITLESANLPDEVRHLVRYLVTRGSMIAIDEIDSENLHISPKTLGACIAEGRGDWEAAVPERIVSEIIEKRLFGFPG